MDVWLIWLIVAVVFLFLEMFTPTLFFINLSVASVISAFCAYCGYSVTIQILVFLIFSIAAIGLIRPLLLNKLKGKKHETGMEDKYIGNTAKVIVEVTKYDGRVGIYGEEWQARLKSENEQPIPVGEEVKIISNDSIVFTVEKIKE